MKSSRSINSLSLGERAIVQKIFDRDELLRKRLAVMGIVAGTEVELTQVAPLGCPIKIKARGYSLSLRRSEADQVAIA